MPHYICKIQDGDTAYYLDWSTVVDAPATFGMSLEEFAAWYREEYGEQGMRTTFNERMRRVEAKGVSSHIHDSFDELIGANRAGKNETCLTKEQIIEWYCRRKQDCEIEGTRHDG